MTDFQKELFKIINLLDEKIKENLFLSHKEISYFKNYALNEEQTFYNKTVENLVNINYINNCLKQKRFNSISERDKFLENQTFPDKKNTYCFFDLINIFQESLLKGII